MDILPKNGYQVRYNSPFDIFCMIIIAEIKDVILVALNSQQNLLGKIFGDFSRK